MNIPILNPQHRWACPNCPATDTTTESRPHSRMHACGGLSGLTAPMVPAKDVGAVEVRAVLREDYVGTEKVSLDDSGRPVMAVETRRPDGSNDLAVLAPKAQAKGGVRS